MNVVDAVPLVKAATHWRIEPPFMPDCAHAQERAAHAGALAGRQLAAALHESDFDAQASFVCSTLLDHSITVSDAAVAAFRSRFETASAQRLHGIVNAYLCTGWGFLLRHLMRNTALRRVALCIVDLDLHDLASQLEHPVIGRAGFGLSTLLFELPAADARLPVCGGPYANSAFMEMLMAVRAHRMNHGTRPTFMPFTRPAMYQTATRVLAAESLAPNQYERLGHCFGSDPWIGLIERHREQPECAGTRVLAAAIGFNGYYSYSEIDLAPGLRTQLHCLDADPSHAPPLRPIRPAAAAA